MRRRGSTRMAWRTQNWRRPSAPPCRVPTPLCFTPPKGRAGMPAEITHSLTQALPLSMLLRQRDAARHVARPDAGVEPVAAVVGEPQRLVDVAHAHHRDDGTERLLPHHQHGVIDVRQDRRLAECSRAVADPLAAAQHLGPARDRVGHVALDDLDLPRAGEGAVVDVGVAAVRADAQRPHLLDQLLRECVGDRRLDVHALHRHAHLSGHQAAAPGGGARGAVEVGVARARSSGPCRPARAGPA